MDIKNGMLVSFKYGGVTEYGVTLQLFPEEDLAIVVTRNVNTLYQLRVSELTPVVSMPHDRLSIDLADILDRYLVEDAHVIADGDWQTVKFTYAT